MIIARTNLRKIPDTCIKCKFCKDTDKIIDKAVPPYWTAYSYMQKKCFLTSATVPVVFNKAKRDWDYTKCKSCPLSEA